MKTPHPVAPRIVVATVLLISMSSCGGKAQYVDDVARGLATGSHSADELADDLRVANGGKSKLEANLADGFNSNDAVKSLLDASEEAAGAACTAWDNGLEDAASSALLSISDQIEADELLAEMITEDDDAKIAAITVACNFESLASSGL